MIAGLRAATDRIDEPARCLQQLAPLAIAAGDDEEASRSTEHLADRPCVPEDECAKNLMIAAGTPQPQSGARVPAEGERSRARATRRAFGAASAAGALGLHAEALEACRELVGRHPDNAAYRAAVKANASAVGLPQP